jgi:hypothetical protein
MTSRPTNPGQSAQPTQPITPPVPQANSNQPQQPTAKTSDQLPKTWHFGITGDKGISQKTAVPLKEDFKLPLKRVGLAFVALFAVVWSISSVSGVLSGVLSGFTNKKPQVAASPTAQNRKDACQGMTAKMVSAKITSKQVDQAFWKKHPDKLNKPIGTDPALRQEWCQIAGELIGNR